MVLHRDPLPPHENCVARQRAGMLRRRRAHRVGLYISASQCI